MTVTTDTLITETEGHLLSGDRDETNRLSSSIGAGDETLTVDFPVGGIVKGTGICIDLEEMLVWSVSPTARTVTVQRGEMGSTPAAHAAGTKVYVNPRHTKWRIFKMLNVEI